MAFNSGEHVAQATELVLTHRHASVAFLQRHLAVGYTQAIRLMNRLAEEGVVEEPNPRGGHHVALARVPVSLQAQPGAAGHVLQVRDLAVYLLENQGVENTACVEILAIPFSCRRAELRAVVARVLVQNPKELLLDVALAIAALPELAERFPVDGLREELARACKAITLEMDGPEDAGEARLRGLERAMRYLQRRIVQGGEPHSRAVDHFVHRSLLPHGRAEQIVGNEWQEHAVPCAFLQRKASELLRHGIPPDSVARWIEPYLRIVTIEKSDAQQLDGPLGLKDVMPEGWRFGGDCMYARLHAQGIRFTAPVEGPACHCAFHSAVRTALGEQNLDRSGATLYSSVETLQPGAVYLLGTNPGGRDEGKRLLRESYLHLPRGAQNAYYDEEWDSKSQQLQKQVQALLRAVAPGAERKVCASNLIFFRSRNQDELPTFWPDAKTCWPVHEHVLNTVMPSIVIAFGNSPESAYGFLKETLPRHGIVDLFRTGHGNTWCEGFRTMWAGKPMFVAGLPHLSRFSLTDEGELRPLIARWLQHRTSDPAGEPPQFLINGGPAEPPQK